MFLNFQIVHCCNLLQQYVKKNSNVLKIQNTDLSQSKRNKLLLRIRTFRVHGLRGWFITGNRCSGEQCGPWPPCFYELYLNYTKLDMYCILYVLCVMFLNCLPLPIRTCIYGCTCIKLYLCDLNFDFFL